jgi:hypothetical protein
MRTASLLLLAFSLSAIAHRSVDPCDDDDDEARTVTVTRRRRTKTVTVTWGAPTPTTSTQSDSHTPASGFLNDNGTQPPVVPLASINSLSDGSAAAIAGFQNSSYVPAAVGDQIAQGWSRLSSPLRSNADRCYATAISSAISAQLAGPVATESLQLVTCWCPPSHRLRRWTHKYLLMQLRTSPSSYRLSISPLLRPRRPLQSTSLSSTSSPRPSRSKSSRPALRHSPRSTSRLPSTMPSPPSTSPRVV